MSGKELVQSSLKSLEVFPFTTIDFKSFNPNLAHFTQEENQAN